MTRDLPERAAPDITCREVAAWTSAYVDEHLEDTDKIRMALHLAVCAGCEAYVAQIGAVRDVLNRLPAVEADPAQRRHLRQAFSARQAKRSPRV